MNAYDKFLDSKRLSDEPSGFDIELSQINDAAFPFQKDLIRWGIKRGRAAFFEACGLGKTLQQLEWMRIVLDHTGGTGLIVAPLAVSKQTIREGAKFGIHVHDTRVEGGGKPDVKEHSINICNYEMLWKFNQEDFCAVVLDESSILKSFDGKFRRMLTDFCQPIPFRLACTATPAPNDLIEITNHAEFLGIMTGKEIVALFFTQDGNTTHKWRLKHHAEEDFWKWMASWCVAIRGPEDLGYEDERFTLPKLNQFQHIVDETDSGEFLFPMLAHTMQERRSARSRSLVDRVALAAELANGSDEQWIMWCNLNAESAALTKSIDGAVEVKGGDSVEHKTNTLLGFCDGSVRVLVSKPSIAGFGMNFQNCHNISFVGLSDSYEQLYQATRRCWRFGQEKEVNAHIIIAETEGAVLDNIKRKEIQSEEMMENIVTHMKGLNLMVARKEEAEHVKETYTGDDDLYKILQGDCVERIKDVESESVGLSIFSPPFPGMYAYTNSARDMGNVTSMSEMIEQFGFLIPDLLRITMPGRSCCIHLCQGVAFKGADGYIGIKDFRGEVIKAMESRGWIYYGEVCIDKDPQVKAIRTKDAGLMFKSLSSDSARMHMALADYMLQFRKPGDNKEPIHAGISEKYGTAEDGWITPEEWIEWAAPVWYRQTRDYPGGIRETDVLNTREGRGKDDEKHICPLQLGVIDRSVKLWSNPGDLIFSPFAGIGSEGYQSLMNFRRFVGCELKADWSKVAVKNCERALAKRYERDLVKMMEKSMARGEQEEMSDEQ